MGIWVTYPAKEENYHRGRRELVEQLQVPDRQRPLHPDRASSRSSAAHFTPNANYWGDKPTYDMEFSYITDSAVAFEAYKNNEFDIVDLAA